MLSLAHHTIPAALNTRNPVVPLNVSPEIREGKVDVAVSSVYSLGGQDAKSQGFLNLQNSREKLVNLSVQVETARRAFDLSDRLYRLGSDTNLNRLTQQDNLLSAELKLIDEKFNEKRNYLALLRSSGRLAGVLK